MAGPLEDAVEFFLHQVQENDTLTADQKRAFYEQAARSLAGKITDGTHRWGMSMGMARLATEAKQKRKKRRDPTQENIKELVAAVRDSSLTRDEALFYLIHVWCESLRDPSQFGDYLKNAVKGDFRYASGLCGRMAQYSAEQKGQIKD